MGSDMIRIKVNRKLPGHAAGSVVDVSRKDFWWYRRLKDASNERLLGLPPCCEIVEPTKPATKSKAKAPKKETES